MVRCVGIADDSAIVGDAVGFRSYKSGPQAVQESVQVDHALWRRVPVKRVLRKYWKWQRESISDLASG